MQNLTFSDHYNNLPNLRKDFIKKITEITNKSPRTVYYWINGKGNPSETDKQLIAQHLNVHKDVLFPPFNNNNV